MDKGEGGGGSEETEDLFEDAAAGGDGGGSHDSKPGILVLGWFRSWIMQGGGMGH